MNNARRQCGQHQYNQHQHQRTKQKLASLNNNRNKKNKNNNRNGNVANHLTSNTITGSRAIIPPKLIVTPSQTPPTTEKSSSPPITIGRLRVTDQLQADVDAIRMSRKLRDCMATKQLSPTFPTSSSSSSLVGNGGTGSGFRCHSNPTSPNYLSPQCFNFTSSGPSPRLSRRRPGSVTRFGRHSPNSTVQIPLSPPLLSNNNNNSRSFALNLSLATNQKKTTSSPILNPINGHNGSPTAATQAATEVNIKATISPIATGGALSKSTVTLLNESPIAKNEVHEQKQTNQNRNVLTRHLSERPEYSVVHYSAKGKQHHLQSTGPRTMNTPLGGDISACECDRRMSLSDVAVDVPPTQSYLKQTERDVNVNNDSLLECQENGTLNGKSERQRSSSGRTHRANWILLQETFSIDSADSGSCPCQDFGIRDYLNLTGESIDNEEESSLAGDFNVGLGVRPPRFSIDSLIDAYTMSHLLDVDETKDNQLTPPPTTTISTVNAILSGHQRHSQRCSASRRRCSDETGLLSRRINNYNQIMLPIATEQNLDARNHGTSNGRSHATPMSATASTVPSSHPSGRLLRKCNSLPHSCLPKINEGGTVGILPIGHEQDSSKSRDFMKASRDEGTIEEMDDVDWTFDEEFEEDKKEEDSDNECEGLSDEEKPASNT